MRQCVLNVWLGLGWTSKVVGSVGLLVLKLDHLHDHVGILSHFPPPGDALLYYECPAKLLWNTGPLNL